MVTVPSWDVGALLTVMVKHALSIAGMKNRIVVSSTATFTTPTSAAVGVPENVAGFATQ